MHRLALGAFWLFAGPVHVRARSEVLMHLLALGAF